MQPKQDKYEIERIRKRVYFYDNLLKVLENPPEKEELTKAEKLRAKATQAETLSNVLQESSAIAVLSHIRNALIGIEMRILDLASKDLPPPSFEFDRDDLQLMKTLRAQKQILELILETLDADKQKEISIKARQEADGLTLKPTQQTLKY